MGEFFVVLKDYSQIIDDLLFESRIPCRAQYDRLKQWAF
jgi:hypothetical protein